MIIFLNIKNKTQHTKHVKFIYRLDRLTACEEVKKKQN